MTANTILGVIAMFSLCAVGCATEIEEDPEEQGDTESELTNEGISGTKLCFKMTSEATLFTSPTSNVEVANNNGSVKIPAGKSRYVLVQRRPGQVKGRVWADVNFSGLTAASDEKVLVSRCGLKNIAEAKELIAVAKGDPHVRRGWMNVSSLAKAAAKLDADQPYGPPVDKGDLANHSVKTVKAGCTIDTSYFGGSKTNPTSNRSYGTTFVSQMYVLYGTPEKDGGGITFGYVDVGSQVHLIDTHVHKQTGEHCQANKDATGAKCNGDVAQSKRDRRMIWAEIWADVDNQRIRGWVPNDCLE